MVAARDIVEGIKLLVAAIKNLSEKSVPLNAQMRVALKSIYFSRRTRDNIDILSNLDSSKDDINRAVARITIRLGDSKEAVGQSIHELLIAAETSSMSINCSESIGYIIHDKENLRSQISNMLHQAVKKDNGDISDSAKKINQSIRNLNKSIEDLDERIGGAILEVQTNG